MILVTGPTGSGKTTTLYSLIKLLNTPDINITTIEDPVEYKIPGINQIQVNSRTDITFAKGLRSIARQDPDIILVGEVRDKETAEIAVNAALTGHLLLSTFHSNDAATAIPRLLDMGIEPFLMASTLELIIAQRLVRRICETCRTSYEEKFVGRNAVARNYFSAGVTLYKGKGCPACNGLGYRGRTAIFEFIAISREMKDLIMGRPSTEEIWSLARKGGSVSIFEDGVKKVESGVTSLEELLRVAEPLSNGSYVKKGSKDKSLG
jgi:type IV pilus assembly protein PilB